MLEKLTDKLTKKMGQSVQKATEPVREKVSKTANHSVDFWSRVARLGLLVVLFVEGTKRVASEPKDDANGPSQIIINNYVDSKPYSRQQRPVGNDKGSHVNRQRR